VFWAWGIHPFNSPLPFTQKRKKEKKFENILKQVFLQKTKEKEHIS